MYRKSDQAIGEGTLANDMGDRQPEPLNMRCSFDSRFPMIVQLGDSRAREFDSLLGDAPPNLNPEEEGKNSFVRPQRTSSVVPSGMSGQTVLSNASPDPLRASNANGTNAPQPSDPTSWLDTLAHQLESNAQRPVQDYMISIYGESLTLRDNPLVIPTHKLPYDIKKCSNQDIVQIHIPHYTYGACMERASFMVLRPNEAGNDVECTSSLLPQGITALEEMTCQFLDPRAEADDVQLALELLYWRIASPVWTSQADQQNLRPKKLTLSRTTINVSIWSGMRSNSAREMSEKERQGRREIALGLVKAPVANRSPSEAFTAHCQTGPSPTSYFSSSPSVVSASSSASFVTAPSKCNSSAFMSEGQSRIGTIMEVDEPHIIVPTGPFEKLGIAYQTELQTRELIQPFDKELNWSGKGQHVVFQPKEEVPLEFLSYLGASAMARVEMVRCRRVALARKTMRCKGSWNRNNLLNEVSHLENLRHFHIIQLVGSYLQGRDFSLLMYPAADCHLGTFLEDTDDMQYEQRFTPEYAARTEFLGTAFHCLASAVECVHQHSTKHMDIKPQNILVRQVKDIDDIPWRIYLSDFGLSRSFASQGHSQTDGPTSMTPKYCAPEVYEYESRGRSSDIFSLGCVYTEMLTVIAGIPGKGLAEFAKFRRNEDGDESFHKNLDKVDVWIKETLSSSHNVGPRVRNVVTQLLRETPAQRTTAEQVRVSFAIATCMDAKYGEGAPILPRFCCTRAPEPYTVYQGPPSPLIYPIPLELDHLF